MLKQIAAKIASHLFLGHLNFITEFFERRKEFLYHTIAKLYYIELFYICYENDFYIKDFQIFPIMLGE
jgi:hypothetical protein